MERIKDGRPGVRKADDPETKERDNLRRFTTDWTPEECLAELSLWTRVLLAEGVHAFSDLLDALGDNREGWDYEVLKHYGVSPAHNGAKLVGLLELQKKSRPMVERLYRDYLLRETILGKLSNPAWLTGTAYVVPTTTGPYMVVGTPVQVVEAVARPNMHLVSPEEVRFAVAPQSVAIPDGTMGWRLVGAIARERAGLLEVR